MQTFFIYLLFIFWLLFWSFASVLISRFYSNEWWIVWWRSHCTKCKHVLTPIDLFPVFSYLFLWGKCRYCKTRISALYPSLELIMWSMFALIGYNLIDINLIALGNIFEIVKLLFFLYIVFVAVVVSIYDYLYQEIPTQILWASIVLLLILLILSIFFKDINNFFGYFIPFENSTLSKPIISSLLWSFVIYTFLYLQIFLPWIYYAIEKKKYKIILTQLIDYFIIPFYMITSVFLKMDKEDTMNETNEEEVYTWMWHWDLWLAIFMWLVWGFKIALLWLLLSYLIWSIFWIYIILIKRERNKMIAFWPFLLGWLILSLMYYDKIINLYLNILWLT